jgi:hypothetical protein
MPELSSSQTILAIYLPILFSAIALIYTLYKDRMLRRKEYADRIRTSAGTIIAKLERWKSLSLRFFEDIGPLLTKTDLNLAKSRDFNKARYDLWIGIEKARAISAQRIIDEQVEMAYKDLYGYDPDIEDLFVRAIKELKKIDKDIYSGLLGDTQEEILEIEEKYGTNEESIPGALLGNRLRMLCGIDEEECEKKMKNIIEIFRKELLKLINATDKQIFEKELKIAKSDEVFKLTQLPDEEKYAIVRSLPNPPDEKLNS